MHANSVDPEKPADLDFHCFQARVSRTSDDTALLILQQLTLYLLVANFVVCQ